MCSLFLFLIVWLCWKYENQYSLWRCCCSKITLHCISPDKHKKRSDMLSPSNFCRIPHTARALRRPIFSFFPLYGTFFEGRRFETTDDVEAVCREFFASKHKAGTTVEWISCRKVGSNYRIDSIVFEEYSLFRFQFWNFKEKNAWTYEWP